MCASVPSRLHGHWRCSWSADANGAAMRLYVCSRHVVSDWLCGRLDWMRLFACEELSWRLLRKTVSEPVRWDGLCSIKAEAL